MDSESHPALLLDVFQERNKMAAYADSKGWNSFPFSHQWSQSKNHLVAQMSFLTEKENIQNQAYFILQTSLVCNSSLRVAEAGFSPNDYGQNEPNKHDHLVLLLPCNLTCPHFLAHPNLSPVIAFPHFITRVTSSFTSGLLLLTPCPAQPSPSCSLAPFVSFQLPVFIMLISPPHF